MAEIFDFYVADNRTIKFNPIEPILQEDNRVAVWRFRIPKMLNNIDMSGFAWWFVYVNAAKQKYSEPLTLTADADDPDNYCIADYTIDYGISLTPGSFAFALEAINANGSGEIVEEWHTKTYSHSVIQTLQGNQAEYSETESDIISALMVQIQQKYNALVGGATPIPVASVSQMTNTAKVYLNTTDKNWYYYNSDSSTWVSGGQYASGIVIDPTLTQPGQAADAKETGDRIDKGRSEVSAITGNTTIDMTPKKWVNLSGETVTMVDGYPAYSSGATNWDCGIIPCIAGDTFTINGHGSVSARLWGFIDSVGNILSVAASGKTETDLILTAPQNSAFLIIHNNDGRLSTIGINLNYRVSKNEENIESLMGNILLERVYQYTGTAPTIWVTNVPIDVSSSFCVYVKSVKNAKEIPALQVRVRYSDSTNAITDVDLQEWTVVSVDTSKTVSGIDFVLLRSDSTLPQSVQSEWNVIVSEGVVTENLSEDINALRVGATGLSNNIDELQNKVGVKTKTFTVDAGKIHSSTVEKDKIYINNINQSSLYLTVKSANNASRSAQAFGIAEDGSAVALTSFYTDGTKYGITVDSNVVAIGVTVNNSSSETNDTFTFMVEAFGGLSIENEKNSYIRKVKNARHISELDAEPLTLVHFSDIHGETKTLDRITSAIGEMGGIVNDAICTGDINEDTASPITSWWNPNILTCVGNHDSASKNGTVYDWTALSMADRDAYYIAPFEANWGVTHTPETSYYYKDYSAQKVRLIVMDGMLYNDNGAEATSQNAWLESLLSDAITNTLHVLIAIHAPHGGSTAKVCSFSRYNQDAMPVWNDCNTPQSVIDLVSAKITTGLHFIGYIVGHTHQDNVWDAKNDGTQLMYCITCAGVATGRWRKSDQSRGAVADAFNLVTIDTKNTLVKIVRGGGADIDDHMRTRKAICINYSTGEVVGEVL